MGGELRGLIGRELSAEELARAREILVDVGAVADMEQRIDHLGERAQAYDHRAEHRRFDAPNCPPWDIVSGTGSGDGPRGPPCGDRRGRAVGLTAALRLRGAGCRVTVVERDAAPGGLVRTETLADGPLYDTGATVLTMPGTDRRIPR